MKGMWRGLLFFQVPLAILAVAGVVYGIDGPGQGTARIVFKLAVGFEGVIAAVAFGASAIIGASAERASDSAPRHQAIATKLGTRG